MTDFREVYDFLRSHCRYSRFEGNGKESAERLAAYHLKMLEDTGWSVISRHQSYNNQVVKFDSRLIDLNADVAPVDYAPQSSHLSHLLD